MLLITKTFLLLFCFGFALSQDIPVLPLEPEEEITTTTEVITTTTEIVTTTTEEALPTTEELSSTTEEEETTTEIEVELTTETEKDPICFYYKSNHYFRHRCYICCSPLRSSPGKCYCDITNRNYCNFYGSYRKLPNLSCSWDIQLPRC